jgi:hypothetical protein
MPRRGASIELLGSGMKVLKMSEGQNIQKQIDALKTIASAQAGIRNNLMEFQGATSLASVEAERTFEPITRVLGKTEEEKKQERALARQVGPGAARALLEAPPAVPGAAPAPAQLLIGAPPPVGALRFNQLPTLTELRTSVLGKGNKPDKTKASLTQKDGKFKLGGVEYDLSLTADGKLEMTPTAGGASVEVTRGLGLLLVGNGAVGSPTDADYQTYRALIPDLATYANNVKAADIRRIMGFGIKRRPKVSMAARIQGDEFGRAKVDMAKLKKGVLEMRDIEGGAIMMVRPVSDGVRHLLLNRAAKTHAGKKYSQKDLEDFNEIASVAKAYIPKSTNKSMMKNRGVAAAVFIEKDPVRMAERLEILIGLKQGGKESTDNINEAMVLADSLLRTRHISKPNHEEIFEILMS